MKNLIIYFKIAIFAGIFTSCASTMTVAPVPQSNMKEIVKDPETTLVDVRIPAEFQEKTAEGAINIPLATIEDNIEFFKKLKQVVIFCNSGRQSTEALEILRKNGVKNVYHGKTLKNIEAIKNEIK